LSVVYSQIFTLQTLYYYPFSHYPLSYGDLNLSYIIVRNNKSPFIQYLGNRGSETPISLIERTLNRYPDSNGEDEFSGDSVFGANTATEADRIC